MTEREIGKSYARAEALRELLEAAKEAVRHMEYCRATYVPSTPNRSEIRLRNAILRYEEAKCG